MEPKMEKQGTADMKVVGILGNGEIGQTIGRICSEAGLNVLVRELAYDEIGNNKVDYLHVNIPEANQKDFIKVVIANIKEISPKLTIINSSITPGTTRKIYEKTNALIVHSPVIGIHPDLYTSVKYYFPKIIGPIGQKSLIEAERHFKTLGLKTAVYNNAETSETAKLLDLVYYAWNIIFNKWVFEVCQKLNLDFEQVYTKHNQIYNKGYGQILPNVIRPILIPQKGPITGHCIIPDTLLFHKYHKSKLTEFILKENKRYSIEITDEKHQRNEFIKLRAKVIKRVQKKHTTKSLKDQPLKTQVEAKQ